MKVFLAQQNYIIGDFNYNKVKILAAIEQAKWQKADLIVFSELAVCGYFPEDFLIYEDFIQNCNTVLKEIKQASINLGILVGCPSVNPELPGKNLYNSAYLYYNQELLGLVNKTLLPTYDIFDEYRYFEPAREWKCIEFKGKKLAITICEDIWDLEDDPLYIKTPMEMLILEQPDLMINLSASPFDYSHVSKRKEMIQKNIAQYHLPIMYCNTIGGQSDVLFDGGSMIFNKTGIQIAQLPYFKEDLLGVEWNENSIRLLNEKNIDQIKNKEHEFDIFDATYNMEHIHAALIMGIQEYFSKLGFKKAILGSSGGIDSAVALALACEALGAENVTALLMPSEYSSDHSINDAVLLSQNLGNPYHILSIQQMYDATRDTLSPLFQDLPFDVTEENIQARSRGLLLMAVSNKFGPILLNTSNKSEVAVGYGTLYGDMAGGLSVLGDVYKLQVYELAKFLNKEKELIPNNIITKAPSAELHPDQKDSDSLPDYAILDALLYAHIEREQDAESLKKKGFDPKLVDRILKMVSRNEYKRNQFCPILRVSPKSFGKGRRMPLVTHYY